MDAVCVADIAIGLPTVGLLTYFIPNSLRDKVKPGVRVLVRVKAKPSTGIVWKVATSDRVGRLKPIEEVLDERPVLTPELMKLGEWISDYYLASIGEVASTMAPPSPKFTEYWRLVAIPDDLTLEIIRAESPAMYQIVKHLEDFKPRALQTIWRRTGCKQARRYLEVLKSQGYVTKELKLRARRESTFEDSQSADIPRPSHYELTDHQERVLNQIIEAIDQCRFKVFLLHGVTGSGKTEVYLRAIQHALSKGKKAIYLVPEIGLTGQVMSRLRSNFGDRCVMIHSRVPSSRRYALWQRISNGEVDVVVGARSAIFAPIDNLGLIVIDEEHDSSYKQHESPSYNAREVAIIRAKSIEATVILGSATPSLETYHNAKEGRYVLCELPERISGGALPSIEIEDMRKIKDDQPITDRTSLEIDEAIRRGDQVLIFLNRRGYSNFVQCRDCGYVPRCRNCNVSLTYHITTRKLLCHYCEYRENGWQKCPKCGGIKIDYPGAGTQRIEGWLRNRFPEVVCRRFDRDATRRKGSMESLLEEFSGGSVALLVGTQMVAKGHDFRRVGLVVANADATMNIPDFRSSERTFQILTQVAGRAGRGEVYGKVIIQTFNPDHHSLVYVRTHDYIGFYEAEIGLRKQLGYPPFKRIARVVVEGPNPDDVENIAKGLANIIKNTANISNLPIDVVGPSRAPLAKIKNVFRWHLIVKSSPRRPVSKFLGQCLQEAQKLKVRGRIHIAVDVDPQFLM
ncbi:MAG: replication restart helicase PriA [bacterium]